MAKGKKKLAVEVGENGTNLVEAPQEPRHPYRIIEAILKDGKCDYRYQVTEGKNVGDKHKVEGTGLIMDSLREAFSKLAVHLCIVDDGFKNSGNADLGFEEMSNHELINQYRVHGIKLKGDIDSQGVVLIGTKYVSLGGYFDMSSPKIYLDNAASYNVVDELAEVIEEIQIEVEKYKEGNFEIPEPVEKTSKLKQTKMQFMPAEDELPPQGEQGNGDAPPPPNEGDNSIDPEFNSDDL